MRPGTTFPSAEREYLEARRQFELDPTLRNAIARDDARDRFFFAPQVRYER